MNPGRRASTLRNVRSTSTERQHMQQSRNLAARAGRWSARHRRIAVLGWIAFVVAAFMVGGNVGTKMITAEESAVGESGKAGRVVDGEAFFDELDRELDRPNESNRKTA